ncbi:uncharacterized protein LOC114335182 [Diabrotica virgifera virgifera]|uniref:Uncharacterized protein LOC114335182 n=1 Tax=Diabrotica virgifera virgifera TaxID=50390 RepID=A0A6P7FXI0_DIAVI|nr:uncharacterized protein LOC114335182 [Diabrotica virgifera virgifera]
MSNKRKWLSLEAKIAIIEESEKTKKSSRILAKQFNVGRTQICTILKDKEAIYKSWKENGCCVKSEKKVKKEVADIDSAVYEWFCAVSNQNIPVTGPMIQAKAMEVAKTLEYSNDDFKASNGWLYEFKLQNNIQSLSNPKTEGLNTSNDEQEQSDVELICEPDKKDHIQALCLYTTGNHFLSMEKHKPVADNESYIRSKTSNENTVGVLNEEKNNSEENRESPKDYIKAEEENDSEENKERPNNNTEANKRRWLSLEEKIAVIEESEKTKKSARTLSKQFNVGKTQICNILKDKDKIYKSWREDGRNANSKRKVKKEVADIDSGVYEWFCAVSNQNIPVTGPMMQAKAMEVAKTLECSKDTFKASNGWLYNFKLRNNIQSLGKPTTEGACFLKASSTHNNDEQEQPEAMICEPDEEGHLQALGPDITGQHLLSTERHNEVADDGSIIRSKTSNEDTVCSSYKGKNDSEENKERPKDIKTEEKNDSDENKERPNNYTEVNKRKWLSLEEKIAVIDEFEKTKKSARILAKQFNVGKTQICYILKDKEAIYKSWKEYGCNANSKKKVKKEVADIDSAVYEWFWTVRNQNIPVTGSMMQAKAMEVALGLNRDDFKASNGWLYSFKHRNNIQYSTKPRPEGKLAREFLEIGSTHNNDEQDQPEEPIWEPDKEGHTQALGPDITGQHFLSMERYEDVTDSGSILCSKTPNEDTIGSSDKEERHDSDENKERPKNYTEAISLLTKLINFCKEEGESDNLLLLNNVKENFENSLILKKENCDT